MTVNSPAWPGRIRAAVPTGTSPSREGETDQSGGKIVGLSALAQQLSSAWLRNAFAGLLATLVLISFLILLS